jgi:hypothetical protein
MTTYRISDAARRTGLPTSTLRYYERIGLLPAPESTDSGYRAYLGTPGAAEAELAGINSALEGA